jgi:chromosomal replication initiation ATPase DnaA
MGGIGSGGSRGARQLRYYDMTIWIEGTRYKLIPIIEDKLHVDQVMNIVLEHSEYTMDQIKGSSRKGKLPEERHLMRFMLRKFTSLTLEEIGEQTSYATADHTTVIHSFKQISDWYDTDDAIRKRVDTIEKKIHEKIHDIALHL